MTTIERRSTIVRLNQGGYEKRLADLLDATMAKQREAEAAEVDEQSAGPKRVGQRSQATAFAAEADALAKQYDDLLTEADSTAVHVTLPEISNRQWEDLADEYPPREDEARDKVADLNMKTFPGALLRASLAAAGSDINPDTLSRSHYMKLERECWKLHNGDDALPFASLVSLLNQHRDSDSKQQPDSK